MKHIISNCCFSSWQRYMVLGVVLLKWSNLQVSIFLFKVLIPSFNNLLVILFFWQTCWSSQNANRQNLFLIMYQSSFWLIGNKSLVIRQSNKVLWPWTLHIHDRVRQFQYLLHPWGGFWKWVCEISLIPLTTSLSMKICMALPKENSCWPLPCSHAFSEINPRNIFAIRSKWLISQIGLLEITPGF